MTFIVNRLANSWLTRKDLDYHLLRASMVILFFPLHGRPSTRWQG